MTFLVLKLLAVLPAFVEAREGLPSSLIGANSSFAVIVNATATEYMIHNGKYSSSCIYCHSNGDAGLYSCNTGQSDQKWRLDKIPAKDVGGKTSGFTIKSYTNRCLASNDGKEVFGWSDCSTGGNNDRSWLITYKNNGFTFENARWTGKCLASNGDDAFFMYTCTGSGDQTWAMDKPFSPDGQHGTPFSDPTGGWFVAASNNADISTSLTTGMSWTDSTTVTNTDQVGLSYSLETSGEFLGLGAKETISATYSHTWSKAVMSSEQKTITTACTATCAKKDLPAGSPGWDLYQWKFSGGSNSKTITTFTCDYLCMPQPRVPKCPVRCCTDSICQKCNGACLKKHDTIVV